MDFFVQVSPLPLYLAILCCFLFGLEIRVLGTNITKDNTEKKKNSFNTIISLTNKKIREMFRSFCKPKLNMKLKQLKSPLFTSVHVTRLT